MKKIRSQKTADFFSLILLRKNPFSLNLIAYEEQAGVHAEFDERGNNGCGVGEETVYNSYKQRRNQHLRYAEAVVSEHGALIMSLISKDHLIVGIEVSKGGAGTGDNRCHKLRCSAKAAAKDAQHKVENTEVDKGGTQRAEHELYHYLEYTKRVLDGVIVGTNILVLIHGVNGLFDKSDSHALHIEQHIGLVLKALAIDGAKTLKILKGNGAQTGLGVGELYAVAKAEKSGSGLVAGYTSRGDAGLIEVTAAENDLIRIFEHDLAAGDNIMHEMLTVAVYGDYAFNLRQILNNIAKCSLERSALSLVNLVVKNSALGIRLCMLKPALLFSTAAVIDYNDFCKTIFYQTIHDHAELFIGVEGGQHNSKSVEAR